MVFNTNNCWNESYHPFPPNPPFVYSKQCTLERLEKLFHNYHSDPAEKYALNVKFLKEKNNT